LVEAILKRKDADALLKGMNILSKLNYNSEIIENERVPFDIIAKKLDKVYLIDVKHVQKRKGSDSMDVQIPFAWPKRAKLVTEEVRKRGINCEALIMVISAENEYFFLEPKFETEELHQWSFGGDSGLGETIKQIWRFSKE
jgi:hypothetical protein